MVLVALLFVSLGAGATLVAYTKCAEGKEDEYLPPRPPPYSAYSPPAA